VRRTFILSRLAAAGFGLYLLLVLGANGQAASGGPTTWLPLASLPTSQNDWSATGVISLLPLLSAGAWLLSRVFAGTWRYISWQPDRVTLPILALAALGTLSVAAQCRSDCSLSSGLRLAIVVANLAWVYLYAVNERPRLFGLVVAIILIQSTVGLGQFVLQHDLGLRLLGEWPLDPAIPGVSVVMRGGERWLRAYGLTAHPNVLAGTLVPLLLVLPALGRQPTKARRGLQALAFTVGFAALFATLARWAALCFALGMAVNLWPWLRLRLKGFLAEPPLGRTTWAALALTGFLMAALYGDAIVGRAAGLDTPVENRSLWERERDSQLALQLFTESPLTGVGLGQYLASATRLDAWAKVVHSVPLWLAAELGVLGGALWFLLLLSPVWRRHALDRFASQTALWLSFWLLGLLQPAPHPLIDLRSALLTGLIASLLSLSWQPAPHLPDAPASDNIPGLGMLNPGG